MWGDRDWEYSLTFADKRRDDGSDTQSYITGTGGQRVLVLDGVKMGARVTLNGVVLGVVTDQFLRYVFPVDGTALKESGATNRLTVAFDSSIDVHGRYMGCTGDFFQK